MVKSVGTLQELYSTIGLYLQITFMNVCAVADLVEDQSSKGA
jgi:hypothetical protein